MESRQCPTCGSKNIHRSRRQGFYERLVLRIRSQRPYRCMECNGRYYGAEGLPRAQSKGASDGNP